MRRGLRVMLFTVEEWGLWGSGVYVSSLTEAQRRSIAMAVNLDTVVGYPRLFALTGGIPQVDAFVAEGAKAAGVPISLIRPILGNSDHYNFFLAGIPTFRLIAGYDDPTALSQYLLTRADTREKVNLGQLRVASMVAAALVATACETPTPPAHFIPPPDLTATPGWGGPPTR
jgi:Zn-dependent M28 family amino/carboxypeptidase